MAQPDLLRSPESPTAIHGGDDGTPAPPKVPAPFRSSSERDRWTRCVELWQAEASGRLRPHRRIDPSRGGGHHLLRALRVLGVDDCLRSILWMTLATEAEYLRTGDHRRGFDTLWNQRKAYPERAEEWLAGCPVARRAAVDRGVPLPDGLDGPEHRPGMTDDEKRRRREEHLRAVRASRGLRLPPTPGRHRG